MKLDRLVRVCGRLQCGGLGPFIFHIQPTVVLDVSIDSWADFINGFGHGYDGMMGNFHLLLSLVACMRLTNWRIKILNAKVPTRKFR